MEEFPIPSSDQAPSVVPPSKSGPSVVLIIVIVMVVITALVLGVVLMTQRKPVATATPTPSASPNGGSESLSASIKLGALNNNPLGFNLSFAAPAAWHTVDLVSATPAGYNGHDKGDYLSLLRFLPENVARSSKNSGLEPTNALDVYDVTKWVAVTQSGASPAQKRAYLDYLEGLNTAADLGKGCAQVPSGVNVCSDLKVKSHVVSLADGQLHGVAYLYMQTQSVDYSPTVMVAVAGVVKGTEVLVQGNFALYDKLYDSLGANAAHPVAQSGASAAMLSARKDFTDGKVASDTQAMYQSVLDMVSSIKILASN